MRVFITGASDGIGAALVRHYAHQSARQTASWQQPQAFGLVARRGDALEALKNEVSRLPGHRTCHIYSADVTDSQALSAAAQDFMARCGLPDIVIANAGISVGTLTEESEDLPAFERVFAVNVLGMVNTFQPFIHPMRAAGCGQLVGIASVAGIRGLPGASAYSASKAAVISYLESLRVELHGSGVAVTTLLPGYIHTNMTARNPYRMPFILPVEEAARRLARLIERRVSYAVMPWQMAMVAKLLRLMPNALFDRIFARAGRKPRQLPL